MIETHQSVVIEAGIDQVWDHVRHMDKWAALMPGLQTFDVISDDDSRWTLKVGVGGMVRTVKVAVHVDDWAGPGRVDFSYKLEGDPVEGGGDYTATALGPNQTEITLHVRVVGGGPMAPMWEAMGGPLLPTFVKAFAEQIKAQIEADAGAPAVVAAPRPSLLSRLCAWVRGLFGAKPA